MSQITTTRAHVRSAAAKYPNSKPVLMELFPDAFEDNRIYSKIGQLFMRSSYPNAVYALAKSSGRVFFWNITHNTRWDMSRALPVACLRDPLGNNVTVAEFKQIIGSQDFNDFRKVHLKLEQLRKPYSDQYSESLDATALKWEEGDWNS
jgi:hypothetical protein